MYCHNVIDPNCHVFFSSFIFLSPSGLVRFQNRLLLLRRGKKKITAGCVPKQNSTVQSLAGGSKFALSIWQIKEEF